jgi:hypothetical protein
MHTDAAKICQALEQQREFLLGASDVEDGGISPREVRACVTVG